MDSIHNDKKIWDSLVSDGFATYSSDWSDQLKSFAVQIATNKMALFTTDDYRNMNTVYYHRNDHLLCDLALIAIHYTDNKNLIISIIDHYIKTPTIYSVSNVSKIEYNKYKNLVLYVLNDYNRLNNLLRCGTDKFDTIQQGRVIFQQCRIPRLIDDLKINPLMISDRNREDLRIKLSNFDFNQFVVLVDGLKCAVPFPKEITEQFRSNVASEEDTRVDYRQPSLSLFKHNGEIYHGYRDIVYKAIYCLNEIKDCADFNELIVLEGSLPPDLINMYIDSCYSHKFNFKKIQPNDIKKFIRFIDQYPTTVLSIDRLEKTIIDSFTENNISYNDSETTAASSLKDICIKYKLKCMYLDIHNKTIN